VNDVPAASWTTSEAHTPAVEVAMSRLSPYVVDRTPGARPRTKRRPRASSAFRIATGRGLAGLTRRSWNIRRFTAT
jgi:hypothetical protein